MKKILALVLVLIAIIDVSCNQKKDYITLDEVAEESNPIVLVEKRIYSCARGGYDIAFRVKMGNDTLKLYTGDFFENKMKIYNTYEPGDTIKYRKEFGK